MIDVWWTGVQILLLFTVAYYYIHRKYSYWTARGVSGPAPIFPFGHLLQKARTPADKYELAQAQKYGKLYGVYTGLRPSLTITDAELIKQVLVKDFASYSSRRTMTSLNEIWDLNMIFVEQHAWKRLRAIATPAFTSTKLRQMTQLMMQCVVRLENYFEKVSKSSSKIFDPKAVTTGFSMDVIALVGFATQINPNEDRSKQNAFIHHGMNIFNMNPFRFAALDILPRSLLKAINVTTMFPEDAFQFFLSLSWKIFKERKANPTSKQNDLLQLLMDAFAYEDDLASTNYQSLTATVSDEVDNETPKEKPTEKATQNGQNKANKTKTILSEKEVVSQCIAFLFAGIETTSSALTHTLFELAQHEDVQERLSCEITKRLDGIDREAQFDEFSDAILNNFPYLDAVLNESLRLHPILVRIERQVTAEDGVKLAGIQLDPKVLVEIPTIVVHRNPEYYPEPERFNPERFMPENKHLLVPYTFLPFGSGPRNCIGMRFALQEAKLCLANILHKYKFSPIEGTPKKLAFLKGTFTQICEDFHLKVEAR